MNPSIIVCAMKRELDRNRSLYGVQPGKRRSGSESTRVALVERAVVGRRKRLPHNWCESSKGRSSRSRLKGGWTGREACPTYASMPICVSLYRSAFLVSPSRRAAWLLLPSARRSASRMISRSY